MTKPLHLSAFERLIEEWPQGNAIVSTRRDQFDWNHGLFYSPLRYVPRPIERPNSPRPPTGWIRDAFNTFVRDEFSTNPLGAELTNITIDREPVDLYETAIKLRDQLEQRLVYGGELEAIISSISGFDPVPRIFGMMCSSLFGNSLNERTLDLDQFRLFMANMKVGCRIALLGLPYRDQNPLRVQNSPSQITLAEALFLVRLHCTALAIYQVLPTGADIVILSDGRLYAPILGVDEEAAQQYVNSMRHLRDHLNLRGTISIIDLKHLIELYDAESGEFEECCRYIFSQLLKWRKSTAEVMFAQQFSSLALGIRWNMNSKLLGGDHCDVAAWISSDKTHSEFPAGQKFSHPDDVDKIAARYAAVNLALRWHNVVSTMLPTAIRGTMHPKPCQVALPRLGSCFPWNGVAIAEFGRGGQIDVQVHSLCEAQRRGLDLVGRVDNKGEIVYYERRR